MEIMERMARDHLPDNIGLEWSGLSYQEKKAGGRTGLVMALSIPALCSCFHNCLCMKLGLAGCRTVIAPIAALGYLPGGMWICRVENDVYFSDRIGMLVRVGS